MDLPRLITAAANLIRKGSVSVAHSLDVPKKEIPGFQLLYYGQMDCSPGWSGEYAEKKLEGVLVHYVRKGKGTVINYSSNEEYHIHGGDAFIFLPEIAYYYVADKEDPWSYAWFCISGEQRRLIEEAVKKKHIGAVTLREAAQSFERLNQFFTYQPLDTLCDDLFYYGVISQLLFDFFSGLPIDPCLAQDGDGAYRMDNKRYILLATGYIAENFGKDLSISEIAKYVGIERSYFSRLFKKHTGMTTGEYLMRYRINKAAFLLENSDKLISNISTDVGFAYEHYFTQVFKRYMGLTPSEYRRRIHEGDPQQKKLLGGGHMAFRNSLEISGEESIAISESRRKEQKE